MRIVLDTNVLLVAIGRRSRFRPIWEAFVDGKYEIAVTDSILLEYEEILHLHSASGASAMVMDILAISPDVVYKPTYYEWNTIPQDPDDNKFFDTAVASGADYLVTNDHHFDAAKKLAFPKVNIITPEQFLDILQLGSSSPLE